MIKDINTVDNNVVVNVLLRDGTLYNRKNIPSLPTGDCDQFISFWDSDSRLRIIPLGLVQYFEYEVIE